MNHMVRESEGISSPSSLRPVSPESGKDWIQNQGLDGLGIRSPQVRKQKVLESGGTGRSLSQGPVCPKVRGRTNSSLSLGRVGLRVRD